MTGIISVIGFALIAGAFSVVLKQYKLEYSMLLSIAAAVIILFSVISMALPVVNEIKELAEKAKIETGHMQILLKALGICYIAELAASACRDAGETSLASKIELACKVSIVVLSLPMIRQIVEIVTKLM